MKLSRRPCAVCRTDQLHQGMRCMSCNTVDSYTAPERDKRMEQVMRRARRDGSLIEQMWRLQ